MSYFFTYDPGLRNSLRDDSYAQEQGIYVVYISHKMDEIFEICDDISVLRVGKLL